MVPLQNKILSQYRTIEITNNTVLTTWCSPLTEITLVLISNVFQLVSSKTSTFIILFQLKIIKQYFFLIQWKLVHFYLFLIITVLLLPAQNIRAEFEHLVIQQFLFSTSYIYYFVKTKRSKNIFQKFLLQKSNIPP